MSEIDGGEWLVAKNTQLDRMEDLEMYGEPTYAPKGTKIQCSVWTYMIKYDGRKKHKIVVMGLFKKER
eukprot:7415332-Ditylum_brightwellii.AAC.1